MLEKLYTSPFSNDSDGLEEGDEKEGDEKEPKIDEIDDIGEKEDKWADEDDDEGETIE